MDTIYYLQIESVVAIKRLNTLGANVININFKRVKTSMTRLALRFFPIDVPAVIPTGWDFRKV